MSDAYLYIDAQGVAKTRFSYSAGNSFNFCPHLFYLERKIGYVDKEDRASFEYGIAVEEAVRYTHENGGGGTKEFLRLWAKHRENTELVYNEKTEISWDNLALDGTEHLTLYEAIKHKFPLVAKPKFQVPFTKEMFPGTELAGIEFIAYIDLLNRYGDGRPPLITDIKTAGVPLFNLATLVGLDQQLRAYAWVCDMENVSFLWFDKCGRKVQRGTKVILLKQVDNHPAGGEFVVCEVMGDRDVRLLASQEIYDEGKTLYPSEKNVDKEARAAYYTAQTELIVPIADTTRQRVEFAQATVGKKEREEIGMQIGMDIARLVYAEKNNFWPKLGGMRYPNVKCPNCVMRGICTGDDALRDELVQLDTGHDFDTPIEAEVA